MEWIHSTGNEQRRGGSGRVTVKIIPRYVVLHAEFLTVRSGYYLLSLFRYIEDPIHTTVQCWSKTEARATQ